MTTRVVVKKNTYVDSVSLMSISTKANQVEGVVQAFVAMGTDMNKGVLGSLDLLTPELEAAGTGDLMILVETDASLSTDEAIAAVEELLTRKTETGGEHQVTYRTVGAAAAGRPGANLAVIAVNGAFAAREARQALDNGLHVMMFSDNVAVEDEVALKRLAHEKGLLMMGPDCGTAIINNVALCFGNAVRPGSIGIVAASGTGSQEVSVRIHDFGRGVSQLIGTGGRDLSEEVGGIMMIDGIRALAADPATQVIVLVSKPPAPSVERKVLAEIKDAGKPVVVCFIGGSEEAVAAAGGHFASGTKPAALAAVLLDGASESELDLHALNWPLIEEVRTKLGPEQRYIRGLFCGGTICDEVMYAALERYDDVWSNIQKDPSRRLEAADASREHTFLDFGDDAFTNGRPHPMIDPSLRMARIVEEAKDPRVGVIAMDFILGYGSHEDPVGVTLPAIREAKAIAESSGRHLEVLGYVLGTDLDTPSIASQVSALEQAGVTIASSSTNTGLLAREFVWKEESR
ncbi:putative enzyme with acyl-CoA domain [Nostocoides japonicum T1-X7]|uniref:Putative enzyme with acyl-CoA domain n=1 Tax=Nostocoides japonicum T1-X7 TaxID=1194083 RepID=A0A077M402_9MICO|nr:acyl-CoA synthetase FdrA [Tetrasphaera japonica]CCH78899.1 putative enzyme with acyl-CoA domain [Tetrasphaera japonica T1-X7]